MQPFPDIEEARYIKVKRSMCAIKHVLHERKRIAAQIETEQASASTASTPIVSTKTNSMEK